MQSGKILRSHYKIIKHLGTGGFGYTYLAQDLDLPGYPKCVVKHLKPKSLDPGVLSVARKLFEREAGSLYKLGNNSDKIPKLFAHFQEGGEFYLVQEYIEGQDISQELASRKKLSESDTIALVKGILEALTVAHQNNVIHRDIKPQNLMRRRSDNKIILIDFGAVKEIDILSIDQNGRTILTVAVGTPGYMPSEQSNGKPKLSSDIYAVGMVGIKALTGKEPHSLLTDPKTGNVIWRNEAQVSNYLANILDKMVHEYFPQRYENAMEVLDVLLGAKEKINLPIPTQRQTAKTTLDVNPSQLPPNNTITQLGDPAESKLVGRFFNEKPPKTLTQQFATVTVNRQKPPKTLIQRFTTVTVNRRGEIISRAQGQAEVTTENLGNGASLEMVKIPGGSFLMGSPETEAGRYDDEGPQHYVHVPEFFIGKYPVTQTQWRAVMGNNPSYFKGASLPVERVSWDEAKKFCQKLSQITGKKYSLPSESQWEYACKAKTTTPFSFGETITSGLVNYYGSYTYADAPKGTYRKKTTDVGIFPPNALGLYDMHGNVWEWCADEWHKNYYGAPTDGSVWLDGNQNLSPQRGGSLVNYPDLCRSSFRLYFNIRDERSSTTGFRVVCNTGRNL
ncbi:MAG: bifunctional serine/threonine-protein kinase/formylglycine-generating enzyme family protein [Trichodesmium sp. St16_bin4-tuft]|nr:bifunctional serine/threonine-protein kinase/formylglycine-generating enzyme family protein [Trichodesmium sp. St16_bin4-tuft]